MHDLIEGSGAKGGVVALFRWRILEIPEVSRGTGEIPGISQDTYGFSKISYNS